MGGLQEFVLYPSKPIAHGPSIVSSDLMEIPSSRASLIIM